MPAIHESTTENRRGDLTDTTQARAGKASRAAASAAEATAETLRTELPSSFVDLFDKTLARTKDMHEKMTTILEHSAEAFEEAFPCANRGSAEYRAKLMEIVSLWPELSFYPSTAGGFLPDGNIFPIRGDYKPPSGLSALKGRFGRRSSGAHSAEAVAQQ